MPVLNTEKALHTLRKTPIILESILQDVSQEQAARPHPIPEEWNVLFVMCHLRDYEIIFLQRWNQILTEDNPHFPKIAPQEIMTGKNYDQQELKTVLADYQATRRQMLALFEGLNDEQWQRRGVHPAFGEGTLLDFAINTALHDVNHIAQIVEVLG